MDPLGVQPTRSIRLTRAAEAAPSLSPDHGLFGKPSSEAMAKIWAATCRISAVDESGREVGCGSGFFVDAHGYVVTCAHVVDKDCEFFIERSLETAFAMERFSAELVSIDFSHDLAVLRVTEPAPAERPFVCLELGPAPRPGVSIVFCGFPGGVDSPRLAGGMVSGYERFSIEPGVVIVGPVLDASINGGNSGGPICHIQWTLEGDKFRENVQVVGIVSAKPPPIPIKILRFFNARSQDDYTELNSFLAVNNGIAYSLDPTVARSMVENSQKAIAKMKREYEPDDGPEEWDLSKETLIRLQVQARAAGASPIGPFAIRKSGRRYSLHLGWYNENGEEVDDAGWYPLVRSISTTGGSFMLLGRYILLYRQGNYRGYWVRKIRMAF